MSRCIHHPGRESVTTVHLKHYCAECQSGMVAARSRVDRHVQPKDCFIWYASANNWQPIAGTGCAHWVAHQRGIHRGDSSEHCLEGYTYRVRTLVQGMQDVDVAHVRVNDIFVTPAMDHTGLVLRLTPNRQAGQPQLITIQHDSSSQGRVAENDFATYFRGRGMFYR
ncbi:MAG: hypothetical protein V4812_21580 [Pseudomonadota bacterium]